MVPTAAGRQDTAITRYDRAFFDSIRPSTALDMIQWLPGFAFSKGDADIRGFLAAAGNVLIDGARPADKQFTLDAVLARIPADEVDHIDVIRGSAPGYEMLGQTVVANVVRKKMQSDTAAVSLSNKLYTNGPNAPSLTIETTRHLAGGRSLQAAASVSKYVDLAQGDGPRLRKDADGNVLERAFENTSGGGTTAFGYGVFEMPMWDGKLRFNGTLAWTDYFRDETDRRSWPAPGLTLLHDKLGGLLGGQFSSEAGAHYDRDFGGGLTNESLAVMRWSHQTYASHFTGIGYTQAFAESDTKGEAILRSDFHYIIDNAWGAELSTEGDYNGLKTTTSFAYDAYPIAIPNATATVNESRGEIAGQITWTPSSRIEIEAGLRTEVSAIASEADAIQRKTLVYTKPRLAVSVTSVAGGQLRFRLEREVGQLDFSNFVASSALSTGSVQPGNANIVPQQAWVYEAVYERQFWSAGNAQLAYRHSQIADAVDRVPIRSQSSPGTVFDAPGNIGDGTQDVIDVNLTVPLERLGLDHGQFKGSGSFRWSAVTDPTTGQRRRITEEKPIEATIDVRQDLPAWKAAWGFTLTGNWTKSDYRFNEIDTYTSGGILDLFAEYQPRDDIRIRAEADNIASNNSGRQVQMFDGPRNVYSPSFADFRRLNFGPSFSLAIRKTL